MLGYLPVNIPAVQQWQPIAFLFSVYFSRTTFFTSGSVYSVSNHCD